MFFGSEREWQKVRELFSIRFDNPIGSLVGAARTSGLPAYRWTGIEKSLHSSRGSQITAKMSGITLNKYSAC
jgi:hypothetical protein